MALGSVWKADEKFVVQFNDVKPKEKKLIFNNFQDWKQTGSGFQKNGAEVFIFSNSFYDEEKVMKLVKSLPFPFTEENRNGGSKKIRTQHNHTTEEQPLTSSKNHGKIKGSRSCSRCGQKGHNSRTCKNEQS